MSLNTTPRTWVASEIVTATEMNTEVRDAITGIQAAWTSYTPALTASTNPTLGSGSSVQGAYLQVGKTITGSVDIVFGTSGVAAGSGSYSVSLPVAAVASGTLVARVIGSAVFLDSSTTTFYPAAVTVSTSTTVKIITTSGLLSATAPVVPAASDRINVEFDYQAA